MPSSDLVTVRLQAGWSHLSRLLPLARQRVAPNRHLVTHLPSSASIPDSLGARPARVARARCRCSGCGSTAYSASASGSPVYWPLDRPAFGSSADGARCGSRACITCRNDGIYEIAFASSLYHEAAAEIVTQNQAVQIGANPYAQGKKMR